MTQRSIVPVPSVHSCAPQRGWRWQGDKRAVTGAIEEHILWSGISRAKGEVGSGPGAPQDPFVVFCSCVFCLSTEL
jgi:hypothetical protein